MNDVLDRFRAKYPGAYDHIDDEELTLRIGDKWPQYLDKDPKFKSDYESIKNPKPEQGSLLGKSKEELQSMAKGLRIEGKLGRAEQTATDVATGFMSIPGAIGSKVFNIPTTLPPSVEKPLVDPYTARQTFEPLLSAWNVSGGPIAEGAIDAAGNILSSSTTPETIGTMATGPAAPYIFGTQMIQQGPESIRNLAQVSSQGDPRDTARAFLEALATTAGGPMLLREGAPLNKPQGPQFLPGDQYGPGDAIVGPRSSIIDQAQEALRQKILSPNREAQAKIDLALKVGEERVLKDKKKSTAVVKQEIADREQALKTNEQAKQQMAALTAQDRAIATGQLPDVQRSPIDVERVNQALAESAGQVRPNVARAGAMQRVGQLTGVRQPQPIIPASQPAGEPTQGGQISFAAPAAAEAIPNARQTAVPTTAEAGFKAGQGAAQPPGLIESVADVVNNKDRYALQQKRAALAGAITGPQDTGGIDLADKQRLQQAPGVGTRSQANDLIRIIDQRLGELDSGVIHPENESIRRILQGRPSRGQPITPTVTASEPGAVNRGRLLGPGGEDLPPTDTGSGPSPTPPSEPKQKGPTAPGASGQDIANQLGYKFHQWDPNIPKIGGKWGFTDPKTGLTLEGVEPGTSPERIRERMEQKLREDRAAKAKSQGPTVTPVSQTGPPTPEPATDSFEGHTKRFKDLYPNTGKAGALYSYIRDHLRSLGVKPARITEALESVTTWKAFLKDKLIDDPEFVKWVNTVAGKWQQFTLETKKVSAKDLQRADNINAIAKGASEPLPTKSTLPDAIESIAQKVAAGPEVKLTKADTAKLDAMRKADPTAWERYKDRVAEIRKANNTESRKASKKQAYKESTQPTDAERKAAEAEALNNPKLTPEQAAEAMKRTKGGKRGIQRGEGPSKETGAIIPGNLPEKWEDAIHKVKREGELAGKGLLHAMNVQALKLKHDTIPALWDSVTNKSRNDATRTVNDVIDRARDIFGVSTEKGLLGSKVLTASGRDQVAKIGESLTLAGEAGSRQALENDMRALEAAPESYWVNKAKRAAREALNNWDKYARLIPFYREAMDQQQIKENAFDIPTRHYPNYFPHVQDIRDEIGWLTDVGAKDSQGFTHTRTYPKYVDSILAGIEPYSIDAFKLGESRITAGNKRVYFRQMTDALGKVTDPTTSMPILQPMPASGNLPKNYTGKLVAGYPVAVHKGYESIFNAMQKPSWFEENTAGRVMQESASIAKHSVLGFDIYHPFRLNYWAAPLRKSLSFNVQEGLNLLDYNDATLKRMADRGEIPREELANLAEKRRIINIAEQTGFNISQIGEILYTDWLRQIPVLGEFNHQVFDVFQRGLMAETYLQEFKRLKLAYPEESDLQVGRRTSRNLNVRFGTLQNQGFIKSKTFMDLLNLVILSPRWNQGLLLSEAGTMYQAARLLPDSISKKRIVAGTLLKDAAYVAGTLFVLNQAVNYLSRGKPTWENDEDIPGAKVSAIFEVGGQKFVSDPIALNAEIAHNIAARYYREKSTTEAIKSVAEGKLGPIGRMGMTLATQTDWRGNHLKDWDLLKEAGKEAVPVPMQGGLVNTLVKATSDTVKGGNFLESIKKEEAYPGATLQRGLSQAGIKVDRVTPSPGEKIAEEAKKRFGTTNPTLQQRSQMTETLKREKPVRKAETNEERIRSEEAAARRATEGEAEFRIRITRSLTDSNQQYLQTSGIKVPGTKEALRVDKQDVRLSESEEAYYESLVTKEYNKYFSAIAKQKEFNKQTTYDKQRTVDADLAKIRKDIRSQLRTAIDTNKVPQPKKRFSIFGP